MNCPRWWRHQQAELARKPDLSSCARLPAARMSMASWWASGKVLLVSLGRLPGRSTDSLSIEGSPGIKQTAKRKRTDSKAQGEPHPWRYGALHPACTGGNAGENKHNLNQSLLLSTYWRPGTLLCSLHVAADLILIAALWDRGYCSILQMGRVRRRKIT